MYRGPDVKERMQVDIMLFRAAGGRTAVPAHKELSSALSWLWRDLSV
ncbi:hypothetical protein [Haloplanus natans]|nr:hypothetical protein [Haloplanus natans]